MSDLVTCQVLLTLEGQQANGFPYVRQAERLDSQQLYYPLEPEFEDAMYHPLAITRLQRVQGLILTADQDICVRLNGQMDANMVLKAGGVLLLWDVELSDDPSTNVEVLYAHTDPDNPLTPKAIVTGIAFGVGIHQPTAFDLEPDSGFGAGEVQ